MTFNETKHSRRASICRLLVGGLLATGIALAAASSASADGWKRKHHHDDDDYYRSYYGGPQVIYVQPRPQRVYVPEPVYVAPQPVYVAPQPVYVAPQPVYSAPSVNVVIPFRFD